MAWLVEPATTTSGAKGEEEEEEDGDEGVFVEVSSPEPASVSSFGPVAAAGLEGLSDDDDDEDKEAELETGGVVFEEVE